MSYSTESVRGMFENAQFINIGFNAEVAYNDLPDLPPAVGLTAGGLETQAVLKSCIQARVALAELNQLCHHFPLPDMLWRIFPLVEAQASAEADGFSVSLKKILRLQDKPQSISSRSRVAKPVQGSSIQGSKQESEHQLADSKLLFDSTLDTGVDSFSGNTTSPASIGTLNVGTTNEGKIAKSPATGNDYEKLHLDPAVNRVLAIRNALLKCFSLGPERLVDGSLLLELCCDLEQKPMSIRREEGMGLVDDQTGGRVYQPPVGAERLQHLLLNWEQFTSVEGGTLDPLVLIAVAHYQLSSIEPFPECSSVLTRLVDQLLMSEEALLDFPVLNLSAWFHANQTETNNLKLKVTQEQEWHQWIQHYIKGIQSVTMDAIAKINTIRDLVDQTNRYVEQVLPKVHSAELINALFTEPCTRIQSLVGRGIAKRQTASVYLKLLCDHDVLKEVPYGKEKLFVNHRLIKLVSNQSNHFESYSR